MKYSICYIDDRIPAVDEAVSDIIDNTKKLDSFALKYLLNSISEDNWEESEVRQVIDNLLNKEDFILSAFTNPAFYFNHNESEIYRPQIFILDWDYAGDPNSTEDYLKQLLDFGFSYIAIYTRYDKQEEIHAILDKPEFVEGKNRVIIWHKEDENSVDNLISHIQEKSANNFSFIFGGELRQKAVNATEKILLDLGMSTSNDISKYFKITGNSNKDLIDFIGERFKSYLTTTRINILEERTEETELLSTDDVTALASKLWSNRLYFYPDNHDKVLRKGDIISYSNDYYLVISAECDLARFWSKNFGFLQIIPLYPFDQKDILKEKLLLTKRAADIKNSLTQSSLISDISGLTQGPFILPFVRIEIDGVKHLKDFFVFPKEIKSLDVIAPDTNGDKKALSNIGLLYDHVDGVSRIACLTEPFLTQTVEHILNVLRGFGVPDYPNPIMDAIKTNTKKIFE
jgi:hypothetical protein